MKKIAKIFALSLFALTSVVACQEAGTEEKESNEPKYRSAFLNESDPSVSYKGAVVMEYDKTKHQVIQNDDLSLYIITSTDYTEQITLSIDGELELNNKITVNYKTGGIDGVKSSKSEMSVIKVDEDKNIYWLWDKKELGFIVRPM